MPITVADAQFKVTRNSSSGLPSDVEVNDWAITLDPSTSWDAVKGAAAHSALESFYAGVYAGSVKYTYSGAQASGVIQGYKIHETSPRVPFYEAPFAFGAQTSGNTALPAEVALCVSYQGPRMSGVNQARRRGRVYLGSFGVSANSAGRPVSGLRTQAAVQMNQLLNALLSVDMRLAVWSRADAEFVQVTNGWIDDAWDTQRRRGLSPTIRSTYSFDTP